jgi:hypothetical protein
MRLGAAEIEIAVAQARFFGGVDFVFDREWRSFCVVQNVQLRGDNLDFAGGQVGIRLLALNYLAFDRDYVFAANVFGFGVGFGLGFFVEDDLNDAGAVADIQEEEIAQVAALGYPA